MRWVHLTVCFVLILAVIFILDGGRRSGPQRSDRSEEFPNEWFFAQRAFPSHDINYEVYKHAVLHTRILKKQSALNDHPWTFAGPTNVGGRLTDVDMPTTGYDTIYAATASGGVFKTVNRGQSWTPIFDQALSLSIGDIAIDPSNPQVIYVGTGEVNAGGGSMTYGGMGMYKSTDGGETWTHLGLEDTRYIARIVIDPEDTERIYVAAMGKLFAKNNQRGLYRSTDGGASWENVLFVSDSTGCIDVVIHPRLSRILYAAMWERIRRPQKRYYGGPTSGLYWSSDGGDTWEELTNGLPHGSPTVGRIGISICESSPNILYAIYADNIGFFDGIYKSEDGGEYWSLTNDAGLEYLFASYGWWFGNIRVDPTNPDVVFALGLDLYKTSDGGRHWYNVSYLDQVYVHVDQHGMVIHPQNPEFIVLGNDGGLYISQNGGTAWNKSPGLPVTQFYTCEIDYQSPNRLYGGTQDNGTIRTLTGDVHGWTPILGGDGFYVLVDPSDNRYVYAEYQWGGLSRSVNGGSHFQSAKQGIGSNEPTNWNAPVVFNPASPRTLYFGTNRVYKSTNRAQYWSAISPDLSNGPYPTYYYDYNYAWRFGTITTIAAAPSDTNVVYAGTDDGNVWVTLDDGEEWTWISEDLPVRWITRVAVDPNDSRTAYVTVSGYRQDDYLPHIFRTTDAGSSWEDISGDLPEAPINDVIIDPNDPRSLYIASDVGVFFSSDVGTSWRVLGTGLPNVPITDLVLHNPTRTLVAATYGRSMYTFDLTQITDVREIASRPTDFMLHQNFPNPFNAETVIPFSLAEETKVRLDVFDMRGRKLRELVNAELAPGHHRVIWDGTSDDGFSVASGSYIYRIRTPDRMFSKRLTLVK